MQQSWIFKSISDVTATTTADANATAINHFPEMPRETLEDHWHCTMTAATNPVGVSEVFPRPSMKTLTKDRYF